jgi:hypothetical protein
VGPQGAQGAAGPPSGGCAARGVCWGNDCSAACACDAGGDIYVDQAAPWTCPGESFFANQSDCDTQSCGFTPADGAPYIYDLLSDCYEMDGVGCDCLSEQACSRSDETLKTNIFTLDGSLNKLMSLHPVEFDWTEDTPEYSYYLENKKLHSLGFIAQEVREFIPEVVKIRSDGYYFIDYPKLNAYLVEGIKEHQVFIEKLESSIIELEKKVNN